MTYVLEKITPEDQLKIIEDAGCDPLKKKDLTYAINDSRDFPKNWAIDREHNSYMCFAPILMRPESMGTSLYFFFREVLYEIRVETPFGNDVSIVDSPPHSILGEFQEGIAAAFVVFGRSGGGPRDCLGNPDSFLPVFKKEM